MSKSEGGKIGTTVVGSGPHNGVPGEGIARIKEQRETCWIEQPGSKQGNREPQKVSEHGRNMVHSSVQWLGKG